MSRLYHENRGEQMNKKIHGMAPPQRENAPYPKSGTTQMEDIIRKEVVHHGSIQRLAYQIYREKGGDALDNWLEAERIFKNSHR